MLLGRHFFFYKKILHICIFEVALFYKKKGDFGYAYAKSPYFKKRVSSKMYIRNNLRYFKKSKLTPPLFAFSSNFKYSLQQQNDILPKLVLKIHTIQISFKHYHKLKAPISTRNSTNL